MSKSQLTHNFGTFMPRPKLTKPQQKDLNEVLLARKEYAASRYERPWLIIQGSYGWGKSHLSEAIVNERSQDPELGVMGHFTKAHRILQDLRDSYDHGSYTNVMKKYQNYSLLVIDDLGAHSNKKSDAEALSWVDDHMLQIIDHRSVQRMETVITLNVPLDNIDPHIRDRINDTGTGLCKIFAKELPSYRTGEIQN